MPAVFDQQGVRFEFPDNWSLEQPDAGGGKLSVTVSSPGTAFWSLSLYPARVRPSELLSEVLTAMRDEYPALEFDKTDEEIEEQPMVGYDLNFFFLDLCNSARVRGFQLGETTYLVLCQAEDREMLQAAPVFRAITTSLLRDARRRAD